LPRDLADLKARIIAAVKDLDAPMLTRVWQELEYRISMCAVSPVVHISNISSCPKKNLFSFPVAVNHSIKVGPFGFLVKNVCNHGERYDTPCIIKRSSFLFLESGTPTLRSVSRLARVIPGKETPMPTEHCEDDF